MIDKLLVSTRRIALFVSIASLIPLAGCKKSAESAAPSKREKINACELITNAEVQAIQGAPVKDVKPSENSDGNFRIAQCFYTAEPFNKSVSLSLTQADPVSAKPRNPREFWKETFGKYEGEAKEEPGDEEKRKSLGEQEEEKGRPPKKIDGIGDAAYWSANRMGGALYVLKKDVFIRVSVGGPEAEDAMINRCKALAGKILSRL